jgi:putative ABC transport system permease protein
MNKWMEHFKIALSAIWAKKVRSFLTMLGVIIGVFTVVELLAVGQGVKAALSKEIERMGSNILIIVPGKLEPGQYNPAATLGVSTLTVEDVDTLQQKIDTISHIAPLMLISSPVESEGKILTSPMVLGTTTDFFGVTESELSSGRFFTGQEGEESRRVAVIGYPVAQELFGSAESVGKKIKIRGEEFEIVGILEEPEETISTFGGPNFDTAVYLPFKTGEAVTETSQVFRILLRVQTAEEITPVKEGIPSILKENHDGADDFTVFTQEDLVGLLGSVLDLMTALLGTLGAISLLVGGIGIMNMMLVSVTERTREIGIRKAIGATSTDILFQFLIESIVLSVLGGLIGIGLSLGSAMLVASRAPFELVITSEAMLLGLGFCLGVGVIFGVAPAIRAARQDPLRALRYE